MKILSTVLALFFAAAVSAPAVTPEQLAAIEQRAMRGDARALYVLGQLYEIGDGVPADRNVARCYFLSAARLGSEDAKVKLGIAAPEPPVPAASPQPRSTAAAGELPSVADCGNGVTMEFVHIPAGTFMMGSPTSEEGRWNNESQVRVTISRPFALGRYEVTQVQWKAVMGYNPSAFEGDDRPVEHVSWNDANAFCAKLTSRERAAGRLPKNMKYTLPTEAQWEYACRAGTTTRFYTGDSESDLARAAWYGGNSGPKTNAVGQKAPNAWGLYDMHGNVWEWCADYYNPELTAGTDPCRTTPGSGESGSCRVARGGGWYCPVLDCRSALRVYYSPGIRHNGLGFRVCAVQEP